MPPPVPPSVKDGRMIAGGDEPALRRYQADPVHRLAEQLAVLGLGDRLLIGADQLDIVARQDPRTCQCHRGVQRGLAAHRRQQRIDRMSRLALADDDLLDHLRRDRLDIGGIGQIRVGHDRRRVGIDQHDPIALGLQHLAGLRAGIIELAGLADHDRPGPDDQNALDVGPLRHQRRPACPTPSSRRRPGSTVPPGTAHAE